jgi:UDP-hydrolysing UDP-N-acetyl-D-glucosamine 2-epimerase
MRICVPITSRAAYARLRPVIAHLALETTPQIILAGSATLDRYGDVAEEIESTWEVAWKCQSMAAGDSPGAMAVETGLLTTQLVSAFEQLRPDFVLAHADRYETMAVAVAASYMNIPLGHTQGGEITGSIDDKVRNAVSMLADYHYPATTAAGDRLRHMGCVAVRTTGCPSIDGIRDLPELEHIMINNRGHGALIDFDEPYMLACMHPDTTDAVGSMMDLEHVIDAIAPYQTVWLQPNVDAFGQHMNKIINQECGERTRIVKHVSAQSFYALMAHCTVMVGNSSASIREGSFMGVPAVVVGSRQANREVDRNVEIVESGPIGEAVQRQIKHGSYDRSYLYGDGHAAEHIADSILRTVSDMPGAGN